MENHVFFGPPTRKEILLYLKDKKYSLVNNPSLKYQIIFRNKMDNKSFFDVANFNFVKRCKIDNFYIKKVFLFNDGITAGNIYGLLPFKNTEKNKNIINLYCRKELGREEEDTNYEMKSIEEKDADEHEIGDAGTENNDVEENGGDSAVRMVISDRKIDIRTDTAIENNLEVDEPLAAMNDKIGKLCLGDAKIEMGCRGVESRKVNFNLAKNEIFVYNGREENKSLQNEINGNRRVLSEITNRHDRNAKAQISRNKLVVQNNLAGVPGDEKRAQYSRCSGSKSKNYADLKKLTERNTLLNSGYKTVIVKHSKRVNFLGHTNTKGRQSSATKRKTKILVKFEQRDHIPPHNINGIRPMLAKSPKLKKFRSPKGKKVVELKRTISVDFRPSGFEFERKNKKMRIE
ncbi:hypothetical protein VCUG_00008 [Vavraia culicis subsp. floridensis]|uniref:Uncharacterized protein n=1 Tax=Vavraia culicis (isolate floridensis) TaxID=948595 RepID=L2GXQ8_VAVCU|nr:uncharacterized protein VCUG_00008 [Vavraia culicis subsp. floridensis]ELA48399.1 hypothetical protein VCUG_00008 [Vavraia culicis subsp. floridensis]